MHIGSKKAGAAAGLVRGVKVCRVRGIEMAAENKGAGGKQGSAGEDGGEDKFRAAWELGI